jgi:methyl-accepting chemotaxis protein
LVNASGETLSDIVRSVEQVGVMIRDIAGAAMEQTSGIEQVNAAIAQMDEMTQQNAALVEQASAAGQAMANQAREMNEVVEFFSIDSRRQSSPNSKLHAASLKKPALTPPKPSVRPTANAPASKPLVTPKNKVTSIVAKPKRAVVADDEWEEF